MEDVPLYIKTEIEQVAKNRNFDSILVVDSHNAMGGKISQEDSQDMITAAKNALDILVAKTSFPLRYGYANSTSMNIEFSICCVLRSFFYYLINQSKGFC